ncbi:MAG TPA: carboxypeptidase regulatory-like domain-containing protein [Patescibacteria group bacterium]|nr:carboxypeptidase regulatory-like domain-containing protein [Patescibacteria group bacterium]
MSLRKKNHPGISIAETIIATAIFSIVGISLYEVASQLTRLTRVSRDEIAATALAQEEFEKIQNLPYASIGIQNGIPQGVLPKTQTIKRDGISFALTRTVRNIDDPFDGTIDGSPQDTSPADYKLVEIQLSCPTCRGNRDLSFSSYFTPKNIEGSSDNGALFIQVFDANGQPIQGSNIHIENTSLDPDIVIDETTNANGMLQLVDTPPGRKNYEITVTKNGYSTQRTMGDDEIPNPIKPHATVNREQVTQISFIIDRLSTLNIHTTTSTCAPITHIPFTLTGSKLISTRPDTQKYSQNIQTGTNGVLTLPDMEWDTYTVVENAPEYVLSGSLPITPFTLSPNSTQDLTIVLAPPTPRNLLITILDNATSLPLAGSTVALTKQGFQETLITGRGFITQTAWHGGAGQALFSDTTKYFADDGNMSLSTPNGESRLKQALGIYASSSWLESSSFDTGSASNFYELVWQPLDQPPQTGQNPVRFQLASNNDQQTWNFVGPDGTNQTYYTVSDRTISSAHNNTRYFRYKLFLSTANTNYTPNIADISFTFTSQCVPSGQVLFGNLAQDRYTATATKTGYQEQHVTIQIQNNFNEQIIRLTPQ